MVRATLRKARPWTLMLLLTGVLASAGHTADVSTPASLPPSATANAPLAQEELDQMLAPLALYPDSLLTQVLMASTYPIEIVQADRWVKANPQLTKDTMGPELEKQSWDASVKSLVNFPDVLAALSEKLEWTIKIGDAFIADQKRVLATIQKLRGKANAQGNLQSNQYQTVVVEQAAPANDQEVVIKIETKDPEVVYVPAYDPTVVYGSWWYPSYPPPWYYQPPYYTAGLVSFGVGFACGAAWGYAWGNCDWHHGDVDIDIDRNTEFNRNIDRDKYKQNRENRGNNVSDRKGTWQHDSSHRRGASYRDQATADRFGGASTRNAAQAREAYRGRAESGRQDLQRGDVGQANRSKVSGSGSRAGDASRGNACVANRAGTGGADRSRPADTRGSAGHTSSSGSSRQSAFSGSRESGSSTRSASSRGQSSRSSAGYSGSRSSGGSRGGVSRSGGGARSGGGRR